jgi:tetratricopeptide (TPR) repeat protein
MPNCIGWIHRELQDFEGALKYDQEGLDVGRDKHVLEAEANSLINLGIDHTHAGKHGETASVFAEARDIFERDKWFRWRYSIRLEAATTEHWLKQGNLAKAKEFAARLFSTASEFKSRKYIAVAHQLKAAIAVAEGEIDGAHAEFAEALAVLDAFPVPVVRWKVLADLGRLLKDAGDREGSQRAFADAREILERCATNVTDEQLRSNFLNSAAVQEVMAGSNEN